MLVIFSHLINKWSIHKYSLNIHSVPSLILGDVGNREVKELAASLIEFII